MASKSNPLWKNACRQDFDWSMNDKVTTSSSLLLLPFTLRELIWRHVFGDSLIHIHYSPETFRFTTLFCQHALETASELQDLVLTANRAPCIATHPDVPDSYRVRHHLCQAILDRRDFHAMQERLPEWNIGAMFACHQFYEEIYPILYGTNILQVESAVTFTALMAVLERQSVVIRTPSLSSSPPHLPRLKLRLEMVAFNSDTARYWPLVLTPRAAEWVEAHVSRLELTGVFSGVDRTGRDALPSVARWCSSLDVDTFAEHCVRALNTPLIPVWPVDFSFRAPSPQRLSEKDLQKESTRAYFRDNVDRQYNISPLFHIRRTMARLSGLSTIQTIEQYKEDQSAMWQ